MRPNILVQRASVLKKVLSQFKIPEYMFSIGKPAEQRVCIEEKESAYVVYMVERGERFEETEHKTEHDAHLKMLYHLSSTDGEYQKMCRAYKKLLAREEKDMNLLVKRWISSDINVGKVKKIPAKKISHINGKRGDREHVFFLVETGDKTRKKTESRLLAHVYKFERDNKKKPTYTFSRKSTNKNLSADSLQRATVEPIYAGWGEHKKQNKPRNPTNNSKQYKKGRRV